MSQKLVILRGPAASGKTTICEKIRDFDKKIAWLSVDKMKPIFSDFEDRTLEESNKAALAELKYLLDEGYSVIFDGIFKNVNRVYEAIQIARDKNIPVMVYQLRCSLETLKGRDKVRPGVKEGYRKPLGDVVIQSIHKTNLENTIEGAIELNTEEKSLDDCLEIIRSNFD
jgi:chloramphenicol 3-O-phosphotransferase